MTFIKTLLATLLCFSIHAQSSVFYFGGDGEDKGHDIVGLSNGKILVSGSTDDLSWLPNEIEPVELDGSSIMNRDGTGKYGFLMLLSSDGQNMEAFYHLGQGQAENIRFIKTTNVPRQTTGDMYISGTTLDPDGGYFIAKLDGNFVDSNPSELTWVRNVKCASGGYPNRNQPWDVDAEGRVYYVRGDSHAYNWSAMYRLKPDGSRDVVEHWRTHWKLGGGEYRASPASSYTGGIDSIVESGIVFKRDGRCNMRSWSQSDYDLITSDGNGGTKKGKWPMDVLFNGPCHPDSSSSTSGPGYTGYKPPGIFTYGPSVVTVDRVTGSVYLGINMHSVLPGGQPDFEPAVVKFDSEGRLLWWSRLYHEVRSDGSVHNSTPDQYLDGIAIDYVFDDVIVNARCHGNNVENFWEGNTIHANPQASAFQNRFTGSSGNIHISWLGRLSAQGELLQATYVAEMQNGGKGMGEPLADPLMDGWPNPNSGWPDLNTTRLIPNTVKVTGDGHVVIAGQGRRTMTTANAHQKMPKPGNGSTSRWNHFIRQYQKDFRAPMYSSILTGTWDTLNEQPGLEVYIENFFKLKDGVVLTGYHNGRGESLPTAQIPTWAKAAYDSTDAVFGFLKAPELESEADRVTKTTSAKKIVSDVIQLWPNPGRDLLNWSSSSPVDHIRVRDINGNLIGSFSSRSLHVETWTAGIYLLEFTLKSGDVIRSRWVKAK